MSRIYVAGPMRGIPEFNFPAFHQAADELKAAGHLVFNPAAHDVNNGFDPSGMTGNEDLSALGFDLRNALAADTGFICGSADAIAFLPGWHESKGARAEMALAAALGLKAGTVNMLTTWGSTEWPTAQDMLDGAAASRQLRADSVRIESAITGAFHPCAICQDPDDHHGAPHGEVTGDGKTRADARLDAAWVAKRQPALAEGEFDALALQKAVAPSEVRITNPLTGGQKGSKLQRFDLLPVEALTQVAEHYGRGAAKYADNQWRKGYDWSLSYAAMQRHANAFWGGEDIDAETGSPHMAAVAWHALTLLTFAIEHPGLDNRPKRAAAGAGLAEINDEFNRHGRDLTELLYRKGLIPNPTKDC